MVEHALAPVLDGLELLSGQPISCEAYRRLNANERSTGSINDPEIGIRIGWVLWPHNYASPNGAAPVRGWTQAPTAFWKNLKFQNNMTAWPKDIAPLAGRLNAVPIALSAQLGHGQLSLAELGVLAVGDALRITPAIHPALRKRLPVQLRTWDGRWSAQACALANELILQTPMRPTMTATPTLAPVPAPSAGPALTALSQIECELRFEIGSLRMSCGEIAKLRAGCTLALHTRLQEQPITVLVHGQAIARGELMAVGDELMVVLTQTQGLTEV
jgi:type III secretion system YscQ/HrcQ family protein